MKHSRIAQLTLTIVAACGGCSPQASVGQDASTASGVEFIDSAVLAQTASTKPTNPLSGKRAMAYLEAICKLGPRPSGSAAMAAQQKLLTEHFTKLGGKVSRQEFSARHPQSGEPVKLANLLVQWHPERTERVMLCAHYDTRPLPDRDPSPSRRRTGRFLGANDGASGVAVMMELAHHMAKLPATQTHGVDFVLFDGEEFVFADADKYFLGSEHFALEYIRQPPAHKYRWGVLLDMVGDADLRIFVEAYSASWSETQPLVRQVWTTAERIGVREFVPRVGYEVRDDHVPLRNIGRIPTCDIIDFDYRYWHTEQDVPARCSGESLAKVGWVMHEWMASLP